MAALPAGTNVGEAIRDAMMAIENSVTDQKGQKLLEGALPKDYLGLEQDLLAELLKVFNRLPCRPPPVTCSVGSGRSRGAPVDRDLWRECRRSDPRSIWFKNPLSLTISSQLYERTTYEVQNGRTVRSRMILCHRLETWNANPNASG